MKRLKRGLAALVGSQESQLESSTMKLRGARRSPAVCHLNLLLGFCALAANPATGFGATIVDLGTLGGTNSVALGTALNRAVFWFASSCLCLLPAVEGFLIMARKLACIEVDAAVIWRQRFALIGVFLIVCCAKPTFGGAVIAISADPTTSTFGGQYGGVQVFDSSGQSVVGMALGYPGSTEKVYGVSYDAAGNLFVLGANPTNPSFANAILNELPAGGDPMTSVNLVNAPGQNQWQLGPGASFAAFEAVPTPEPSTLTLVGVGVVGMIGYRCRRKRANL